MAIHPIDFDTTTYDKVTGKRIKENPTWNNKQFWILFAVAAAFFTYLFVR